MSGGRQKKCECFGRLAGKRDAAALALNIRFSKEYGCFWSAFLYPLSRAKPADGNNFQFGFQEGISGANWSVFICSPFRIVSVERNGNGAWTLKVVSLPRISRVKRRVTFIRHVKINIFQWSCLVWICLRNPDIHPMTSE